MNKLTLNAVALLLIASAVACKKDDVSGGATSGKANLTLELDNNDTFTLVGSCGWASLMGTHYIGAQDSAKSTRALEIGFKHATPPSATKTYTFVKYSDFEEDTDESHINLSFNDVSGSNIRGWLSTDNSGTLEIKVNGKKVTATLNNRIESNNSFANDYPDIHGTLKGTIEFTLE